MKFGWAGITLDLPDDWEIAGMTNDLNDGYLRIDDELMPRLELKWSNSKSKSKKPPDLHAILDDYFKLIRKTYKRSKTDLKIKRNVELLSDLTFFESKETVFFDWRGDIHANGVIFFCPISKRIVIVQVMSKKRKNLKILTQRILTSIDLRIDEPSILWTAYGLRIEIPKNYRLDKQKLMANYLMFSFLDRGRLTDRKRRLSVERYGLAELLLKNDDLETWFRRQYAKAIAGIGFEIDRENSDGDENLILIGHETRWTDSIPIGIIQKVDQIKSRKGFVSYVRHCPESNRIFVVQALSKKEPIELAITAAKSLKCH